MLNTAKTWIDKWRESSIENERLFHKECEALCLSEARLMIAEIERLKAENKRMIDAFELYCNHSVNCDLTKRQEGYERKDFKMVTSTCTCGIEHVLGGPKETVGGST